MSFLFYTDFSKILGEACFFVTKVGLDVLLHHSTLHDSSPSNYGLQLYSGQSGIGMSVCEFIIITIMPMIVFIVLP